MAASTITPTLLGTQKGLTADQEMYLSSMACVLYGDKRNRKLKMLQFNIKTECYQEMWCHEFPPLAQDEDGDGIAEGSPTQTYSTSDHKCILSDGMVVLSTISGKGDKSKTATTVYNQYLERYVYHLGQYGRLIGALPQERVAYVQHANQTWIHQFKPDQPHCIAVYTVKEHKEVFKLKGPWPHDFSPELSLGSHGDNIAVVDHVKKTLDIFCKGEHKTRVSLSFTPAPSKAVGCNSSHIYILQEGLTTTVHIHNWKDGSFVSKLTHEQLKLKKDDWTFAIGIGGECSLHLGVGNGPLDCIDEVYAYKI